MICVEKSLVIVILLKPVEAASLDQVYVIRGDVADIVATFKNLLESRPDAGPPERAGRESVRRGAEPAHRHKR